MQENLTHELIGRRLEREIIPDLAEGMGYKPSPNIIRHSDQDIEVDYLGETDRTTSQIGTGRLITKQVSIVETKTTICKDDIEEFSDKVQVIKEKFERASINFGYTLEVEVWIMACYGWT